MFYVHIFYDSVFLKNSGPREKNYKEVISAFTKSFPSMVHLCSQKFYISSFEVGLFSHTALHTQEKLNIMNIC